MDSSRLKARVAADHLLSLINDTLELSKLENEKTKLAKEDFCLPELIREVETIAQMKQMKSVLRFVLWMILIQFHIRILSEVPCM